MLQFLIWFRFGSAIPGLRCHEASPSAQVPVPVLVLVHACPCGRGGVGRVFKIKDKKNERKEKKNETILFLVPLLFAAGAETHGTVPVVVSHYHSSI